MKSLPLALALSALALAGCKDDAPPAGAASPDSTVAAAQAGTPVETMTLAPTSFAEALELTGTFEAINDAILSAQGAGTLVSLLPLGTAVGAGQAVGRLDPGLSQAAANQAAAGVRAAQAGVDRARTAVTQAQAGLDASQATVRAAQAALEGAQAQASLADDNFRRQERLYRDSIISALEFQQYRTQRVQAQSGVAQAQGGVSQAQAGVAQAQAAVAQAQGGVSAAQAQLAQAQAAYEQASTALRNTLVLAPFSGRVEQHYASRGEQLTPGRQVARVVAAGRLKIAGNVPERYAGQIRVGDPVDIAVPGQPAATGRVMFVAQAIDPATRTFRMEVEVGNSEGTFKPAMSGRMSLRLGGADAVLVVPRSAVVRTAEGSAVYVVAQTDSGRVAVRTPVVLGETSALQAVITEGLQAGDEVIVSGQTQVDTGTKVRPTPARATPAPSATGTASTDAAPVAAPSDTTR